MLNPYNIYLEIKKKEKHLSNKAISSFLSVPITNVEHWFRTDNCFSIPDANIWYSLKGVLGITDLKYDLPITSFIEQDNKYDIQNRLYDSRGLCPTLTSTMADKILILEVNNENN